MPGEREGIHGEVERLTDDERQYLSFADRGDIGGMADLRERTHTAIPDFALNKLWMDLLDDDDAVASLSFVRQRLGVMPDESFIRSLEAQWVDQPRKILALMRVSGVRPDVETLQTAVKRAFDREEYGTLEELKHLLGDLPPIEHADLLRRYEKHLKGLELVRIIELFDAVGIPVLGKEQLAALFDILLTNNPQDALELERVVGEQLEAKPEAVAMGWFRLIQHGNVNGITAFTKRFGPASPEVVQRGYQAFFREREQVNSGYSSYPELRLALDVEPSAELVQTVYRDAIINQRFDTLHALYAMLPRFPSRDVIQEGYEKFIALGRVGLIRKLRETTEVRPDPEVARRGLLEFFKSPSHFIIGFKSILSELEYVPDAEEIRVFTDAMVTRWPPDDVLVATDNLSWHLAQDQVELLYSRSMVLKDYEIAAELKKRSREPLAAVDDSVLLDELDDLRVKLDEGDPKAYLSTFRTLRDAWPSGLPLPGHPHPWGKMFERLALAYPAASREEYDPWETELKPLLEVQAALNDHKSDDAEIFYDFIQEYGMYNLPTILRWHAAIRRAKDVEDIADNEYVEIQELLGRSIAEFSNPGAVVVEIKKFRRRLQEALLADEIPGDFIGPGQAAAIELFNSLKGSTSWERDQDAFMEMLGLQERAWKKNPEYTKAPEGYEPVTLSVSRIEERREERGIGEAIYEIIQNPDVLTFLERYDAAFHAALDTPTLQAWWGTAREAVLQLVEHELANVKRLYEQAADEKKKRAMEKKLAVWEGRRDEIASLAFPELPSDAREADKEIVRFFERLIVQLPEKLPGREDLLRGLSAAHVLRAMPEQWREMIEVNQKKIDEPWDTGQAFTYADVLRQYLNEHYLHPSQEDHDRVMHAPFSKELLRELRGVWGLRGDLAKHPLIRAREKIDHIMRSGTVKSEKKMDVTLVPVKGLLRTYAGDIGDACYTSQHRELARGEFPGITAFIFVTGRGTSNERLRGSVLAVETKTPAGDGVLVVRANNPQEGLLQQVDRDELVGGTVDVMVALAERRGLQYVVAPQDGSSASQTNRESVAEFYDRYGDAPQLELVDEPETNFNGYGNWNPRDNARVGVVWERK